MRGCNLHAYFEDGLKVYTDASVPGTDALFMSSASLQKGLRKVPVAKITVKEECDSSVRLVFCRSEALSSIPRTTWSLSTARCIPV